MSQKQSRSESHDKGAVVADKPLTKAQAKEAMVRFESLTRQLLTVSRARLRDEQDHYEKQKHQKKPIK
jgi:hypothetical protein